MLGSSGTDDCGVATPPMPLRILVPVFALAARSDGLPTQRAGARRTVAPAMVVGSLSEPAASALAAFTRPMSRHGAGSEDGRILPAFGRPGAGS